MRSLLLLLALAAGCSSSPMPMPDADVPEDAGCLEDSRELACPYQSVAETQAAMTSDPWFFGPIGPMKFDDRPSFTQVMNEAPRAARLGLLDGAYRLAREPATEDVSGALRAIVEHVMGAYLCAIDDMIERCEDRDGCVLQTRRNPEPGTVEWTRLVRGDVELGRVTLRWALGEEPKIEATP